MTLEKVGRYRIDRKLGEGTFASVWLAFDPELDDVVAIKVLAPRWAEKPDVRERFLREARLLRRLAGDRIVQIHDIDQLESGQPYFVMEYADRGSLADRLAEKTAMGSHFEVSEAVETAKGVAMGLQVAHRADVVHRDLKPANVLFVSVAQHEIPTTVAGRAVPRERLVLADFGLARALGTVSGQTANVGTPFYAAPEQFEARADGRSDLYALSVVLYEMLAGQRPFGRQSLDRSRVPDVREHNPAITESLAGFLRSGMAPDPQLRPQSAREWLTGLTEASAPVAFPSRVRGRDPETPGRASSPSRETEARSREVPTRIAPPPGSLVGSAGPQPSVGSAAAPAQPGGDNVAEGEVSQALLATSSWSDDDVERTGIPIVDVPLVSVGGGIGTFVLVDHLRIAGVPTEQIRVLAPTRNPYETYSYLARTSQIPDHERLRSDSGSTPDNIWGFPSYAIREALGAKSFKGLVSPLWNVVTEPILRDYYTPRARDVYQAIQREAERIRYAETLHLGHVRTVRRRLRGGYFVLHTPEMGRASTKRVAYRATYVHLAVGYPGVRFLQDLQRYREEHKDFTHVVAAYEPHEHVYHRLKGRGGTVMVRGSGIVASRVLQRLIDDRDATGADITIWHVFRNYVAAPQGPVFMRRPGANGFAYQGFNYTKSAWGGQHRQKLLSLPSKDRPAFINAIGGTNTAPRRSWKRQLERGRREGFYHTWVGEADEVQPAAEGVIVKLAGRDGANLELAVDFIIDATGLEADIRSNRLLADVIDHTDTGLNPLGRLDVTPSFVVDGADSPPGRLYASGSATLGGPFAPADSFFGLQYQALEILEDLARRGFCRRIGSARSISQWIKWMRKEPI